MLKAVEYKRYIKSHKDTVSLVWEELKKEVYLNPETKEKINRLISKHDMSKYSEEEFEGYRQFFYPEPGEEKNKELFDISWNHHNKRNPHHWEYWLLHKKDGYRALEIPVEYVIEMLCDWTSMSVKFGNIPSSWYEENKERIVLEEKTQRRVEELLSKADRVFRTIRRKMDVLVAVGE